MGMVMMLVGLYNIAIITYDKPYKNFSDNALAACFAFCELYLFFIITVTTSDIAETNHMDIDMMQDLFTVFAIIAIFVVTPLSLILKLPVFIRYIVRENKRLDIMKDELQILERESMNEVQNPMVESTLSDSFSNPPSKEQLLELTKLSESDIIEASLRHTMDGGREEESISSGGFKREKEVSEGKNTEDSTVSVRKPSLEEEEGYDEFSYEDERYGSCLFICLSVWQCLAFYFIFCLSSGFYLISCRVFLFCFSSFCLFV